MNLPSSFGSAVFILRKTFSPFLVAAALASPLAAQESTHPAKPFLWKIEGKELQKPSYLFGTIHLSSPEMKDLHPAAEKAFTSADALFTEIPMDPADQVALMPTLIRADGKTLAESIGKELSAALDEELKAINPALDSLPFQTMKTWVMAVTLPLLKSQLQGQKALDSILWARATKAEKKAAGIETDRNVSMSATIDEKLQAAPDQVNFFAVGTGHLVGKESIVTLLAAKGYQITRIQD
jgi:uncharacterized protein YbaP (TraB family)